MLTSEGLTELKYQEFLEYREDLSSAAMHGWVTNTSTAQVGCLVTAVLTSLVMGCLALVFAPRHNNQR